MSSVFFFLLCVCVHGWIIICRHFTHSDVWYLKNIWLRTLLHVQHCPITNALCQSLRENRQRHRCSANKCQFWPNFYLVTNSFLQWFQEVILILIRYEKLIEPICLWTVASSDFWPMIRFCFKFPSNLVLISELLYNTHKRHTNWLIIINTLCSI